jgi:hypothetical protein
MTQFEAPPPDLQITFYHRLVEVRKTLLLDALLATVATADVAQIDLELNQLVSRPAIQRVAGWGLRGEIVFAVPYMLTENPYLLGYYRLLLGFSQKQFYAPTTGFSRFKSMEESGILRPAQRQLLEALCQALCISSEQFIAGIDHLTQSAVHDLTLLTFGAQLRGGALNRLGSEATERVFHLIRSILQPAVIASTPRTIEIRNAAGRVVRIEFASDPDICIREELASGTYRSLVAIEIKGGRDVSNIHNRIGEAEKSHQKARNDGFVECWTMIGVANLDIGLAKKESPSTDRFFNIDAIAMVESPEHLDFREHLLARTGVRD